MTRLVNDTRKKHTGKKEVDPLSERWEIFREKKLGQIITLRMIRPYLEQLSQDGRLERFHQEIIIPYYPEYIPIVENMQRMKANGKHPQKELISEKKVKAIPMSAKKSKISTTMKSDLHSNMSLTLPAPSLNEGRLLLRAKLLEAFAEKNKVAEAERKAKEAERKAKEAERKAKETERKAKEAEQKAMEAKRIAKETAHLKKSVA
jgi:hypothetical protein